MTSAPKSGSGRPDHVEPGCAAPRRALRPDLFTGTLPQLRRPAASRSDTLRYRGGKNRTRRYRSRRDVEDLYRLGHLLVAELESGTLLGRSEALGLPLLVVWGRQDRLVPVEHGEALAATVAGSRLEVLDACGHCPQIERPDLLLPLLEPFLQPVALFR